MPLFAALFILGPERLPGAATSVAKALRQVQQSATSARAQLTDELGPELDDLRKPLAGLHKLRGMTATSLITQHLFDGDASAFTFSDPAPAPVSGAPVSMAKGTTFDPVSPQPPLALGERPPYDPRPPERSWARCTRPPESFDGSLTRGQPANSVDRV